MPTKPLTQVSDNQPKNVGSLPLSEVRYRAVPAQKLTINIHK
ncbi:hypothetical protein [Vibrio phage vB_ValP_FGH]|nr:hypothetical protein [Vibrio phage vB_ValP_FGH]